MVRWLKANLQWIKRSSFLFTCYKNIAFRKYLIEEKNIFLKLKSLEMKSEAELYKIQEKMLLDLLLYAYNNTSYYKALFDEHKIDILTVDSLKKIPLLTKNVIRNTNDNFLISKRYSKKSLNKRNTGGSTGEPLEFYSDRMAGHIDNAHHWYLYSLMGYEKGDSILDSGGINIPISLRNKNIFWLKRDKDSVWGEYCFSALYITDKNIQYYIDKLKEIKPSILRGYPSFFNKLAEYILSNKININFKIKGINLSAEMCSLTQRKNIEKAFSSMVFFEYGHAEVSLFCYTKDDNYFYQSSPVYGYIEVLREDGSDADIGDVGNIYVTGFCNHGMPFIRYQTGDLGELLYRNGGIVKFKKIHGRSQDFLITKDKQKIFLTALIFGQHLKAFKNIKQWQLMQNEAGKVIVKIIKGHNYCEVDEIDIVDNFRNAANIDLEFNYVSNIPLTKRGKHLFLIQNIGEMY